MILMFAAGINDLICSINRKQARLNEITRKIRELHDYAECVGDGKVSMEEMASVSGSMFGRMFRYIGNSHNYAFMSAQNQMQHPGFGAMLEQQTRSMAPEMQPYYKNWVFQSLYRQAREQYGKQEARLLNQQEKKLVQEKERLEASIKAEEADLESKRKARDKGIEQFAPKYTA